jgi:hypothetical protein
MIARIRTTCWVGVCLLGFVYLPGAMAILARGCAEAFWGDPDLGKYFFLVNFLLVVVIACADFPKFVMRTVFLIDLAAIPITMLLVRIAHLFPSNRIDW